MALPYALFKLLPSIVGRLGKIIGGDKGKKMQEAGQTIDEVSEQYANNKLPPEQQAALKTAIMGHEQKLKEIALEEYRLEIQNLQGMRDLVKTSLRSEDPYVRRARPTFLWLVYVIMAMNFIVFPIIGKASVDISELLKYFLWAYLGYGGLRSIDKNGGNIKKLVDNVKKFAGMKKIT